MVGLRDGPFDSQGEGGYSFYSFSQMIIFFSPNCLVQLFFLSSTEQNCFLLRQRGWGIFVWRNVSVLEGELGAARCCAKGKICNDRRSLQIQLGVWGAL